MVFDPLNHLEDIIYFSSYDMQPLAVLIHWLSFIYDRMIKSHFWSTFKLFDCAVCIQIQSETGSKLHSNQVTINFRLQISGSKMACMSYCIICMTSFKSKMDQKFIWDNPMQHFCRPRRCKSFFQVFIAKSTCGSIALFFIEKP